MARSSGCGSIAKRPRSRCSSSSASASTARKCCWPSRAWAARRPRPGGPFSTTSSLAAEFLIVDGAAVLEKALAAVWDGVPTQRCTVHKHRNLLAHAPERLRDEISADYSDMIYAKTAEDIEQRRGAFLRKWR